MNVEIGTEAAQGNNKNTSVEGSVLASLQRKSHLCIPRKGITRPQSQFPHLYVCEWFIYSHDRSAYSAAGKYVLDQSWEYINRSRRHECGWKLELRPRNPFSGNTEMGFLLQCAKKYWPLPTPSSEVFLPSKFVISFRYRGINNHLHLQRYIIKM
jgi:hypothetical protein